MINENEVRIGNFLIDIRGNTIEVDASLFVADMDPEGVCDLADCSPIPITKEWLVKFGFEQKFNSDYHIGLTTEDDVLHGLYCKFTTERCLVFLHVNDDYEHQIFLSSVRSIHKLQNVYFATTGKELKIK